MEKHRTEQKRSPAAMQPAANGFGYSGRKDGD